MKGFALSIFIVFLGSLFDFWAWNGLFHAVSIGEFIGFTILAIVSVPLSIIVGFFAVVFVLADR